MRAMLPLRKGRYLVRLAEGEGDLRRAQRLRWLCFLGRGAADAGTLLDADAHDAFCRHVLVEDLGTGTLVCCFRFLPLASGSAISASYAAQYYDLTRLGGFPGRMIEMGRFCVHPDWPDPDILRLAWGAMAAHVEAEGVEMLFGCSSFHGTDPEAHADAFAVLTARHLAPRRWLPRIKAPDVVRYARQSGGRAPDARRAQAAMPPLLRTYLAMGAWVSDHAVVDRHLGTLHVFTGLEIGAIPEARRRLLRAAAA